MKMSGFVPQPNLHDYMTFLFAVSRKKLRNKAGLSADNPAFFVLEIRAEKKCKKMLTWLKSCII